MFVKPAMLPGDPAKPVRVRLCHAPRRFLRAGGEEVPETQDWHRAIIRGDVVLVPADERAAAVPAPAAAEPATGDGAR